MKQLMINLYTIIIIQSAVDVQKCCINHTDCSKESCNCPLEVGHSVCTDLLTLINDDAEIQWKYDFTNRRM